MLINTYFENHSYTQPQMHASAIPLRVWACQRARNGARISNWWPTQQKRSTILETKASYFGEVKQARTQRKHIYMETSVSFKYWRQKCIRVWDFAVRLKWLLCEYRDSNKVGEGKWMKTSEKESSHSSIQTLTHLPGQSCVRENWAMHPCAQHAQHA